MTRNGECGWVRRNLTAFLDGELSPGEAGALERHLEDCGECARLRARLDSAWKALDLVPPAPEKDEAEVSLFASGSEVAIAVEARKFLRERSVFARVVSVPCFELFRALPAATRRKVIGDAEVKVAVEAAVRQGWDEIIGSDGAFVGMTSFGASAPSKELYKHFGITPEKVAAAALSRLGKT